MKSLRSLTASLFLLAAPWAHSSQDTTAVTELSLNDAIRIGLENNYQVRIAENNLDIARNENDEGFAGAYPNVNATLNLNNTYNKLNQPASFLRELSTGSSGIVPGVDANWVLYDGGRVRLTKAQLEELEARSEGDVRIAVENSVEAIILSYYGVLLRQENVRVLGEVLQLSRDRIEFEQVFAVHDAVPESGSSEFIGSHLKSLSCWIRCHQGNTESTDPK